MGDVLVIVLISFPVVPLGFVISNQGWRRPERGETLLIINKSDVEMIRVWKASADRYQLRSHFIGKGLNLLVPLATFLSNLTFCVLWYWICYDPTGTKIASWTGNLR